MNFRVGFKLEDHIMNSDKLITFNFYFSVWLSIIGGIAFIVYPDLVVPDEEGVYGPLRNNLLIAIGYLVISQIGLWFFRYIHGSKFEALFMAYTFLATAAGASFYGNVNSLPVSTTFVSALVYLAFSHGLYYFYFNSREIPDQS